MPAYRFTWDHFSDTTVKALADAVGYTQKPGIGPRDFLASRVKRPNEEFVRQTKDVLVRHWLPSYAGAKQIVDRLLDAGVGPMGNPRSASGYAQYIAKTRNCGSLRAALVEALIRFGDADRSEDAPADDSFIPRFAVLDTGAQSPDERRPHNYQVEAWEKLTAHLAQSETRNVFQGLLVMPTGAGKTFTTVRWLAEQVLSRGKRVLWLAHRHELLQHAAAEIHRCAARIKGIDKLRVRIVSGQHCTTSQIDPSDHVVVASVASLARSSEIRTALVSDPNLFVVIDEAHHAPAKSYRDIIRQLQSQKRFRVLGLTATPTRTIAEERPILNQLFAGNILYQVDLRRLIDLGTLARPRLVRVSTQADVESGLTDADRDHFARFGDLSEAWLARIANITERNSVIVQHYLSHRSRYGKTLMFAVNVDHAALLAEQLRESGVLADYVASYRPDGSPGDPMALIRAMREGHLDVLVNVQMLTEGVDIPAIQTVFLTRPTQSEILFRQMVGRALRGPTAGGTEDAYLVSFEDHWKQYLDWEHPFELVPDIVALEEPTPTPATPEPNTEAMLEALPWDLIRATAARMREVAIDQKADAFDAIPHGWYVLEREELGEEPIRRTISVYQHQLPCWEAMLDDLYRRTTRGDIGKRAEYDEFFGDCDDPRASFIDCESMIEHWRAGGDRPKHFPLEARERCDPYEVAKLILEQDLGERGRVALMEQRYSPLAQAIYPSAREYRSAIEDALHEASCPDDSTRQVRAIPIFEPRSDQQLKPGPHHDLAVLLEETLRAGWPLLGLDESTFAMPDITIEWTGRLVKGWYAMAHYVKGTPFGSGRIRVNRLLDSPDVSADTMRFLLWHEFLHLYLQTGHPPTFRDLERRWPTATAGDHELEALDERFGVQYW
ncbi:DEAD/DEAH box helicase [Nannocystaceae bacterium ST9]